MRDGLADASAGAVGVQDVAEVLAASLSADRFGAGRDLPVVPA